MKTRIGRMAIIFVISSLLILIILFAKEDNYAYSCTYEEALNSNWNGYEYNDVVRILNEDVTVPTELIPEQRKACLIGDMKDFYEEFNRNCGEIKYEALCAISALETGYFSSDVCKYYNNVGGMRNSNGYFMYSSKEEGIKALSDLLSKEYLDEEGSYYEGTTILDVSKHYNPSVHWVNMYVKVRLDMEERAERIGQKQKAMKQRGFVTSHSKANENPYSVEVSDSLSIYTDLLLVVVKAIS